MRSFAFVFLRAGVGGWLRLVADAGRKRSPPAHPSDERRARPFA